MRNINSVYRLIAAAIISTALIGCETAPPTIQSGPDAELSFDGLHRVINAQADAAWARPDFDISGYSKIMFVRAGFEYREVEDTGRSNVGQTSGQAQYINEATRENFESLVAEVFREELSNIQRFEIVDKAGPDVLMIRGGLLDVVSYVPRGSVGSNTVILISLLGEATLLLELRDSLTGKILARSVDRRAAENRGVNTPRTNNVTNPSEIRRIIRFWARRLREGLDGFGQ